MPVFLRPSQITLHYRDHKYNARRRTWPALPGLATSRHGRPFRFPAARDRHPDVGQWFADGDALRGLAEPWFDRLRACGPDVRELIHDRRPTACVEDAAFAYVDAHAEHATIGFFFGAFLEDPAGLLDGEGKRMRHVKLRLDRMPDEGALGDLVTAAYRDMCRRLDEARS